MTVINPVAQLASLSSGPSSSGFVRNGREVEWSQAALGNAFESGPCTSSVSYPNKQSLCDDLLDDERDEVADADPKPLGSLELARFYEWTHVDQISCTGSDVNQERTIARIRGRLANTRSSKFAQEFSDGWASGSPSLRSVATPLSSTAYSLQEAISRLLDARADIAGPHVVHVPLAFKPFAQALSIDSNLDYLVSFDNYAKTYIPATNISGGGAATAPNASQAWIGITGGYEWSYGNYREETGRTIDARRANTLFVQGEEDLWFRFETCNTFLAKATLYS